MNMISLASQLDRCTRCGACKAECPTYLQALDESMSARGRLRLLAGLESGGLEASRLLKYRIGTCIHCGACDTACPAGIDIQEHFFSAKTRLNNRSLWRGLLGRFALTSYGTDRIFRAGRLAHRLLYKPLGIKRFFRSMPEPASEPLRNRQILFKGNKSRGRVALFVGCSINYLYPEIGEDLLDILLSLGYEVVLRQGELCCGMPFREMGDKKTAVELAVKNLDTFSRMRVEAILSACPTCTLSLKVQYPKLIDVPRGFPDKVMDVNQFLSDRLDLDLRSDMKVIYHDPCHLRNGLSVRAEPRKLISQTGAELIPNPLASECCGFGGIFGLAHYSLSRDIGKKHVDAVTGQEAPVLVTSCPGCKMQFEDVMPKEEGYRVLHTVELLREAMVPADKEKE